MDEERERCSSYSTIVYHEFINPLIKKENNAISIATSQGEYESVCVCERERKRK